MPNDIKLVNFNPENPLHAKIYEVCKVKYHAEVKDLPPAEQELVIKLHTVDALVSIALKAAGVRPGKVEPAGFTDDCDLIDHHLEWSDFVSDYLWKHVWNTPEARREKLGLAPLKR